MAPRYRIRLRDQAGSLLAEFDHFRRLEYRHEVDAPGYYSLTIGGHDDRRLLFGLDHQVEVLRSDLANGLDWYKEFEGLHRKARRTLSEAGDREYTSFGPGYLELLSRRVIAYYAGTAQSDKSGVAESVMKEFVEENCGPSATIANGRLAEGTMPGFTVQADAAGGPAWSGARAWDNLLEVLQGLALVTGWRFDVVGTGPATFEFRTYEGQRGADKTAGGTDPATGLNPAGNPPLVFSIEGGSIRAADFVQDASAEITAVLSLGRGEETNRDVVLRTSLAALLSPWNSREATRNASNEREAMALENVAYEVLEEHQAGEDLSLAAQQIASQFYGLHYTWGDRVTVRYDGIERDKEIVAASVTVDEAGETVRPEFAVTPI